MAERRTPFSDIRRRLGAELVKGGGDYLQERGPDERWVGLVLVSDVAADTGDEVTAIGDVPAVRDKISTGSEAQDHEDEVTPSNSVIGPVTVSVKGHSVGRMLAMAYARLQHAWPGSRLVVKGRPRVGTATAMPLFDPQGMRLKA